MTKSSEVGNVMWFDMSEVVLGTDQDVVPKLTRWKIQWDNEQNGFKKFVECFLSHKKEKLTNVVQWDVTQISVQFAHLWCCTSWISTYATHRNLQFPLSFIDSVCHAKSQSLFDKWKNLTCSSLCYFILQSGLHLFKLCDISLLAMVHWGTLGSIKSFIDGTKFESLPSSKNLASEQQMQNGNKI